RGIGEPSQRARERPVSAPGQDGRGKEDSLHYERGGQGRRAEMLPLVRPGGLILAHNLNMVPDYVKAVTTNPDLETVFYMEGNQLGVTLKKRFPLELRSW